MWASEEVPLCADHAWGEYRVYVEGGGNAQSSQEAFSEPGQANADRIKAARWKEGAFCTRCGAWRGELGSEPTVELFITHLVQVFRAVRRVLRDDGTLWVNLSGSFFNNPGGKNGGTNNTLDYHAGRISPKAMEANRQVGRQDRTGRVPRDYWLKPLDYVDVPGLFAHAMCRDGWLWRSDMALVKKAPMPESIQGVRWERCRVKVAKNKHCDPHGRGGQQRMLENPEDNRGINPDWLATYEDCPGCPKCENTDGYVLRRGNGRPTRAWERLLVFAKGPGYYWDSEAVREPNSSPEQLAHNLRYAREYEAHTNGAANRQPGNVNSVGIHSRPGGAGRNLRDWQFWEHGVTKEAHYAAYPTFIPRLALKAGTSRAGACGVCGAPWARVIGETDAYAERHRRLATAISDGGEDWVSGRGNRAFSNTSGVVRDVRTLAWRPTCSCKDAGPPVPCVVLDCFGGSGTTALVAQEMGLDCVLVDLNPTYNEIAQRRNTNGYTQAETDAETGTVTLVQRDLFTWQEAGDG